MLFIRIYLCLELLIKWYIFLADFTNHMQNLLIINVEEEVAVFMSCLEVQCFESYISDRLIFDETCTFLNSIALCRIKSTQQSFAFAQCMYLLFKHEMLNSVFKNFVYFTNSLTVINGLILLVLLTVM